MQFSFHFKIHNRFPALDSIRISFSPGLDDIDYRLLRALPNELLSYLLALLNLFYRSSSFPEKWFHSIVHFILKPHGSGFRPISFTSCVLKILEYMILNSLYWFSKSPSSPILLFFSNNQFGFRKFRLYQDNSQVSNTHHFVVKFDHLLTIDGVTKWCLPSQK